mmetsp:Transcript_16866/g.19289  ORF Transcript_16866/g.19289 Transcript_16866/m.19289 type:complete len:91 (+) Transcript_16866:240-512(+)
MSSFHSAATSLRTLMISSTMESGSIIPTAPSIVLSDGGVESKSSKNHLHDQNFGYRQNTYPNSFCNNPKTMQKKFPSLHQQLYMPSTHAR